jgi:hypothetical protein
VHVHDLADLDLQLHRDGHPHVTYTTIAASLSVDGKPRSRVSQ